MNCNMQTHLFLNTKIAFLFFSFLLLCCQKIIAQSESKSITILHTNDLQSRLLGFAPNTDFTPLTTDDDLTVGGIARVAHVIRNQKAIAPEQTLILDGGDWMMGTLFQTIGTMEGAELRLMQAIGYDAAVIGNHEFDFHCDGLADIIESALTYGDIPQLLLSNGVFSTMDKADDRLESLFKSGKIAPHYIIEKNGLRIGMFGLLGTEAANVAPYAKPMTFVDPIETAKKMVAYLKNTEKSDVIICMTHSGVWRKSKDQEWEGPDIDLANAVPEIDVIISGHTHTPLPDPILINGTPIVQAGSEGQFVGKLKISHKDGRSQMTDYQLIKIDDAIDTEVDINAMVDSFQTKIDRNILNKYNVKFTDVITETPFDLTISNGNLLESNLGAFAADAVRYGVEKYADHPEKPVIGFTTAGLIRDNMLAGEKGFQQVSDLFRILPLGRGMTDDDPGYPLALGYLTPAELKSVLEILLIAPSLRGNNFHPYFSGIKFKYNPNRMLLDRVFEIETGNATNGYTSLDINSTDKLIGIGANAYIYESLSIISEISKGLLSVTLKHADGSPIENIQDALLDFSKTEPGIQEVKEWSSLFEFTKSFPDINNNNLPDIPAKYKKAEIRQIEVDSWHPASLYKNATRIMWGSTIILIIPIIFIFIILFKYYKNKKNIYN